MRTRHPPQGGEPDFVRTGTAMTCYMTQKPLYGVSWPNLEMGPLGYLFSKRYLNGRTLLQNHTRACQAKLLATVCSWQPHATGTGHWRRHILWKSPPREENNSRKPFPAAMLLQRPLRAKLSTVPEAKEKDWRGPDKFPRANKRDDVERPQINNDTFLKYSWEMADVYLGKGTCVLPSGWTISGSFHHKWNWHPSSPCNNPRADPVILRLLLDFLSKEHPF